MRGLLEQRGRSCSFAHPHPQPQRTPFSLALTLSRAPRNNTLPPAPAARATRDDIPMSRSRALALLLIGCACCCGSAGARTAKEWAHIREKDMEDVERQWADGDAEEELVDDAQACMGPAAPRLLYGRHVSCVCWRAA